MCCYITNIGFLLIIYHLVWPPLDINKTTDGIALTCLYFEQHLDENTLVVNIKFSCLCNGYIYRFVS